jgi:alpha 1,2-mannosyltransferase
LTLLTPSPTAIYEYERTIQTLWPTVKEFAKKYPQHIAKDNAMHFLVDNISEGLEGSKYNL